MNKKGYKHGYYGGFKAYNAFCIDFGKFAIEDGLVADNFEQWTITPNILFTKKTKYLNNEILNEINNERKNGKEPKRGGKTKRY